MAFKSLFGRDVVGCSSQSVECRLNCISEHYDVVVPNNACDLLTLLAEDPGVVYTRDQILEQVWDPHWFGPTKTLDVHVASLRKKLGDPAWIETVRGVGFRLVTR